jgi:drug/metabolite transporter (DMT)-like permease
LPSGVAGAISGAIPCITALVVALALPSEMITRIKLFGLFIGLIGVALTALGTQSPGSASGGASILFGTLAVLAGALSYALAIVYARRFMNNLGMSPLKLAAYQMILASALLSPSFTTAGTAALWSDPTAAVGVVVGLGLVGTGLAFVIYYYLIARLGALATASVYYIPPGVALVVGALALGERVHPIQIAGTLAILFGIYFVTRRDRNELSAPS